MNFPPEAQKGKSVKSAWAALVKWAKATALRPGPGVRLAHTGTGTIVSFHAPRQVFRGAFPVTVSGDRASVGFGTIEGREPTIGGKPASAGDRVAFRAQDSDPEGRLWLVLRVTLDGKKISNREDAVTIAQSSDPRIKAGPPGTLQHPLAMLRSPDPKKPGLGATLHQIEYFHLRILFAGERPFILPVA